MYGEYQRVYAVHCLHKLWHTVHLWAWSSVRAILRYVFEGSVFTFLQVVRTQKPVSTATTLLWYPLGHIGLEMSPYVAIQSPSLCLFQILWRPQALLLLFLLPWIPPARQLIGGNNKLSSFKPLTNVTPNWRSKTLSHANEHTLYM